MNFLDKMNNSDALITIKGKQYTNSKHLPMEVCIFNVYNSDQYDGEETHVGYLSATDLLNPLRVLLLKMTHPKPDTIIDISQLSKSARGTSHHSTMEQALEWQGGYKQEIRNEKTINNWRIAGKFDMITPEGQIKDLKHVAPYSLIKLKQEQTVMEAGKSLEEMSVLYPTYFKYQFQLSTYAWLNQDDIKVPYGAIIFMINGTTFEKDIEQESEVVFPLYPAEQVEQYIITKTTLLDKYLTDKTLPLCTDEERWAKPAEYKLTRMNKSGKFATVRGSKFTNEHDFRHFVSVNGKAGDQEVIKEAEYTYCEHYCPMSSVCSQYQDS